MSASKKLMVKDTTARKIFNNLERWYLAANPRQINEGMGWYLKAQNFAQEVARDYMICPMKVAGVISALSPNNKWNQNKIDTITVIEAFLDGIGNAKKITKENQVQEGVKPVSVCTYDANKCKAFNILNGTVKITAESPKTFAFMQNIGNLSALFCTVDKWCVRSCLVRPFTKALKNAECQESPSKAHYEMIQAQHVKLAAKYGITAYQLQAIIWITIKDHWGR